MHGSDIPEDDIVNLEKMTLRKEDEMDEEVTNVDSDEKGKSEDFFIFFYFIHV